MEQRKTGSEGAKPQEAILTGVLHVNEGCWLRQLGLVRAIMKMEDADYQMDWFLSR